MAIDIETNIRQFQDMHTRIPLMEISEVAKSNDGQTSLQAFESIMKCCADNSFWREYYGKEVASCYPKAVSADISFDLTFSGNIVQKIPFCTKIFAGKSLLDYFKGSANFSSKDQKSSSFWDYGIWASQRQDLDFPAVDLYDVFINTSDEIVGEHYLILTNDQITKGWIQEIR